MEYKTESENTIFNIISTKYVSKPHLFNSCKDLISETIERYSFDTVIRLTITGLQFKDPVE